jgi:predicted ribosome quality control (RQC) complex YloA/Tae2 family protein
VGDHKIKFEGQLNSFERRNVVFQKIKKLRRGEGILNERLKSVEEMLEGKEETKEMISSLPVIRPIWGKTESPKPAQTLNPHHDFRVIKLDNCQLGVGNNANGNDQLRNKWASKEDIWFHLDGIKSAHAILKLDSPVVPSPELVNLVASILAYFSHFNGDWIPIIFTSVKNLKGVTGAPGMVTYKKEKHLSCPRVEISTWLKE